MIPVFCEHIRKKILIPFEESIRQNKPVELHMLFMQFTMSTFLEIGLGCTDKIISEQEMITFAKHFDFVQDKSAQRGFQVLWQYMITGEFKNHVKEMNRFVNKLVAIRKSEGMEEWKKKSDIFSRFLLMKDDDGKPLSDTYLAEAFLNFLLAGRDTTAALCMWTLYELSKHPEVEQKILEEIADKIKDVDHPLPGEILQLKYTKRVLTEVLRIHPSVPIDARCAIEDITLPSGTKAKAGTIMLYLPILMGQVCFDEPKSFLPDRWTAENAKNIPAGAFAAFHLGPQTCLGKEMAYAEAMSVMAMLLPKFKARIRPEDENKEIVPKLTIILVPENGLYMNASRRKKNV